MPKLARVGKTCLFSVRGNLSGVPQLTIHGCLILGAVGLYWFVIPVGCYTFTFAIPTRNVDPYSFRKKKKKKGPKTHYPYSEFYTYFSNDLVKAIISTIFESITHPLYVGKPHTEVKLLVAFSHINGNRNSIHGKKTIIWPIGCHTETLPGKLPSSVPQAEGAEYKAGGRIP